jgi:RNA polymerase sigma factor (TIGR02999 family)
MATPSGHEITKLLQAWGAGDQEALGRLVPLVYDELHRLAGRYMAQEQSGPTLQTTALVNELYLRLVDVRQTNWEDRARFFAFCAQAMRHILIDLARSRRALKRGGDAIRVSLEENAVASGGPGADLLALDDALSRLAAFDARKGRVVELRFFGGLSVEETAAVLKVSSETVLRDWKLAKVWLLRELSGDEQDGA